MNKICGLLSTGALLLHSEKHTSGLDYVSRVDGEEGTWYYWLSSMPGVYELKLKELTEAEGAEISKLAIRYYPDVEEECFEKLSCKEQLLRVSEMFDDTDVVIPENPDVCPCCGGDVHEEEHEHHHCHGHRAARKKGIPKLVLRKQLPEETYVIGSLELSVTDKLESLKLTTQDVYKEYVEEGIKLPDAQGKLVELVPPQGLDKAWPGLELVNVFMDFFINKFLNVLSINCILKEKLELTGESKHFLVNKQVESVADKDVQLFILTYMC